MIRQKRKLILGLMMAVLLLSGCGRRNDSTETPTPTATPEQTSSKRLNIRTQIDRSVPSLIDRFAEVQIVELVNGQIPTEPVVVGTASRSDVGHTQGLTSETPLPVTAQLTEGKEYGARVGIFDSEARGVMLLTSECLSADACRFFPNGTVNSFMFRMIPAVDTQTFYDHAVPPELRAKCAIQPNETKCGVTRTMQYYDPQRDTCSAASWGGCEESKTFKSAADCLQACRRSWQ